MPWSNSGWRGDDGWSKVAGAVADAAATTAFLARADAITSVGATERAAYKSLINGLDADGVFALLDALWILATDTAAHADLNLVSSSFTLTGAARPTFAVDQGYTGNTTSKYSDTGFVPFTSGVNYTLNSCSSGGYIRTSRTTNPATDMAIIGANPGSNSAGVYPWASDGKNYFGGNSNNPGVVHTQSNAQGMYVGTRTSSSNSVLYYDGAALFTDSTTASVSLPNTNVWVGADSASGGYGFSSDQIAAAFLGGGLNSTQAAALSSRINAYMTALGANVY